MTDKTYRFSSLEELLYQATLDRACEDGLEWAESQSFETIFKDISFNDRYWCLCRGYIQFAEDCPWEELDGWDWYLLLSKQPQLSEYCDWNKLNKYNWVSLISASEKPQFLVRCPLEIIDGQGWAMILAKQPQLAEYCSWEKLSENQWRYLLLRQPQLAIHAPENK